ncbi:hypothetical protein [Sphingomonas sp. ERG5]|uniref:hypothetical protein n=1 Tax=Sphingomonas sp. ERG5 TaxID=1381597 RepID=UPI001364BA66|nr:hypothetical protein [Sphingomonas sp. ERG5]
MRTNPRTPPPIKIRVLIVASGLKHFPSICVIIITCFAMIGECTGEAASPIVVFHIEVGSAV